MSAPLLLRTFVKERLTAAAEEIFQVFERTIEKYEEEASSSKQEIERLRGLLLEFVSNHKTDLCQSSICKEETPPEQQQNEPEPEPEPRRIKEEDQEFWVGQQQDEEERVQEFQEAAAVYLPQASVWEGHEHEEAKPSLQPQTHDSGSEQQLQEMQDTTMQDGQELQTSNQTQSQQNQTSIITSRESSDSSHLSAVAPDYHCCLCEKSFSSNHLLINHAFRLHSKDAGSLCAVCGKTLESAESLNVHLKSHRASKCCDVCGKHCNSSTALAEHKASHTGVKLHRCPVCGKECRRKGDLKIHMRIHTGEKPFCCSYCCKTFTHSGHLRKHMRSHTGERPHRCDVCGKGFLQSVHLKYHLGTHTQKY